MELNRAEIIKVLEWCIDEGDCEKCPIGDASSCHIETKSLALIKELSEKVENYRNELGEVRVALAEANNDKKKLRADTMRKMHSLIKERCIKGGIYPAFVANVIDQIAKEMLEG